MDNRTQVAKIDFELWESELHPRGSNEFLLVGLAVLAAAFMVGFVVFVL